MSKHRLKHWFSAGCLAFTFSATFGGTLSGCFGGDDGEAASTAPPPPPPPLPAPPPGTQHVDSNLAIGAPADALKALEALGQLGKNAQAELGPVVSFRDLAPFLKDDIGSFKADGKLDGKTTSIQGMQISEVKRSYKNGEQRLRVSITDTSLAPFMRAGFAMAQMIQEDSTRGYKKGGQFQGQPGIAEWKESGQSELHVLAGGRFLVDISISKASAGDAEQLFAKLDVPALIATAKKAKNNAAAPVPANSP